MSSARTPQEYLAELPAERRAVVSTVRDLVRRSLPAGYAESMGYGMIAYTIPLDRYPDTYNGQPLCYAALAAQKNHFALYLMGAYGDAGRKAWLEEAFRRAGKRFEAGKSCVRFQKLDDLPLDAIAAFIAECPVETFIARYEASRAGTAAAGGARKQAAKKQAAKKGAAKRGAKKASKRATAKTAPKRAAAKRAPRRRA